MSNNEIKDLLGKLRDEIGKTKLDDETLSLVRDLDADIDDLLDPAGDRAERDSVLEKARELETNFATEHPTIERFMREFIDVLVRMGI
jgi:chorismate mutase